MALESPAWLKYKFSCCSSRCLEPAVAIVTAVELGSISHKLFLFQGRSPSGLARRYRAHATASHAQDCPGQQLE